MAMFLDVMTITYDVTAMFLYVQTVTCHAMMSAHDSKPSADDSDMPAGYSVASANFTYILTALPILPPAIGKMGRFLFKRLN
jgi:hypothetical protein